MRADRLLSMLMLLQAHGRMTARELAQELEVSERTVYRDINALSFSGVPVYAERGPGGGISLVESYRSDLTGLNKAEVRALFMLSIPTALAELGLDQELRAALRKLSAALPATLRDDEQRVRQRIHLDPAPWAGERSNPSARFLHRIHQAVWDSQVLEVRYRMAFRPDMGPVASVIHPYGLVAKAGNWRIVARRKDHIVVLQVQQIEAAKLTGETFQYPQDFDLVQFWEGWCRRSEQNRPSYPVLVRVSPQIADRLPVLLQGGVQAAVERQGDPDHGGWILFKIEFEYLEQARRQLLPFGGALEVLEPFALRVSMADYARQISEVYAQRENGFLGT